MFKFQNPVHILRTCTAQMTGTQTQSQHFVWPREGPVSCDDWDPTPECGHGLHGALRGEGDGRLFNWDDDAVWMVVEAEWFEVVDLDGAVKFPRGNVILAGSRAEAVVLMQELYPHSAVIAGTATAGNYGTATAGDGGTATAGDDGAATAGHSGTATAGRGGTATAGDDGTIAIKYWNGKRYKLKIGYIGEDNLEPDKPYRLNEEFEFVEVTR